MRQSVVSTVIAVLAFVAASAPALAHDEIVGTAPENGAQLDTAPEEIRIDFSENASPTSAEGRIIGPDGQAWESGPARIDGRSLVIAMRPATTDGLYTVDFSAVGADGHPITGSIGFELLPAGGPPTTPGPTTDPAPAAGSAPDDAAADPALWIGLAAGVGVIGLSTIVLLRRVARSNRD